MNQKLTILFDLDGTLVDTAPDLMNAHNHVMKKFGFETKTGSEIKKDERIKNSGDLSGFSFDGQEWEIEPRTAFYDWLYIQAVYRQSNLGQNLENYNAFSDIEFNPRKSFNCQARSCALYVSLMKRQILENVLRDRGLFLEILGRDEFYQRYARLV